MFTVLTTLFLATLATAAPQPGSGGSYVSVGNKYSATGCAAKNLIFADPIYVSNNCTALDRFGNGVPILSYETDSVSPGCTVKIYTGAGCTGTAYDAPVGGCVSGNSAFVSTYVTCPA